MALIRVPPNCCGTISACRSAAMPSSIASVTGWAPRSKLPISPLAGEMSGRTEGGVKERGVQGYPHA
ncbi:hypothetical protein FJ471_19195 [Mesorhizobium sp. B2-7-1]|nr:hypothetical protein FJ471_19195 [Mesorhizobium sp. B2-7-1]